MKFLKERVLVTFISTLFFLFVLEILLRLGGYFYLQNLLHYSVDNGKDSQKHIVLTIGDSYTAGGNGRWEENYPSQLQKILSEKHPGEFSVVNAGICEANSSQALKYLHKLIEVYKIDTVVLLVGATNRFNPSGFNGSKAINFFSDMRVVKLFDIFMINLKGRMLEQNINKHRKKKIEAGAGYAYNKTMDWENDISFCTENDLVMYESQLSLGNADQSDVWLSLAKCYTDRGNYVQAEVLLRKVTEFNRESYWSYKELGKFYYKQGRFNEVIELYAGLIDKFSEQAWPYVMLADYYMERGQDADSESLLKKALALDQDQGLVYSALGRLYERMGRYKETVKMYEYALKWSQDVDTYTELAWANIRLGNFEDAVNVLFATITAYPDEFLNYYFLLQAYQLQSKYDAQYILNFLRQIEADNHELRSSEDFQNYILFLEHRDKLEKKIDDWLKRDLVEVVDLCKKNGVRLIMQNYPYTFLSANKILKDVADKFSLDFVDNHSMFSKFPPEEKEKYFSDFEHCTLEGHQIMAKNVYEVLIHEK